jgi:hypothetical protein
MTTTDAKMLPLIPTASAPSGFFAVIPAQPLAETKSCPTGSKRYGTLFRPPRDNGAPHILQRC